MPIKEESFRIGSGRYVQGPGYLEKTWDEIRRLGTAPLIIGGKTALAIARGQIESSLRAGCKKYEFITHTGTCNEPRAKELAQSGFDGTLMLEILYGRNAAYSAEPTYKDFALKAKLAAEKLIGLVNRYRSS